MPPRLQVPLTNHIAAAFLLSSMMVGCAPLDLAQLSSDSLLLAQSSSEQTGAKAVDDRGVSAPGVSTPAAIVRTATKLELDPDFDLDSTVPSVAVAEFEAAVDDQAGRSEHSAAALAAAEWETEILAAPQTIDSAYTMSEIVAAASANHPLIRAASREIDVARAGITTASAKANPNFVIDLDTPVHDRDDAHELTSRITFPFGVSKARHWRRRVALTQVVKAKASFEETHRQVTSTAEATALRTIYLQQRLELDTRAEDLAKARLRALTEGVISENPGKNLLSQVDARMEADEATRQRFTTSRELAVAYAAVTSAMGSTRDEDLFILGSLEHTPLALPSLDDVIADTEGNSVLIAIALAELSERRAFHCLQQSIGPDKEFGPRYQDRLGRDDDNFGLRLDVDLDIHRVQSGPIAQSAHAADQQLDRVAAARHQWIGEVTRIYRELESLATEIAYYREDGFIADQQQLLDEDSTANLMTAAQKIRIKQAIVQRQLEQLQRLYAVAVLRSQIQLDLWND